MSSKLEDNYEQTLWRENKPFVRFNIHQVPDFHDEQEIEKSPMRTTPRQMQI